MKILDITRISGTDVMSVRVDLGHAVTTLGIPFVVETEEDAIAYITQNYATTQEEVDALNEESKRQAELIQYKSLRQQEYPPIGDQLDALWKGGDAAAEMLAKIQAVKEKYPKPDQA